MFRVDEPGKGPGKQKWADDKGDGAETADRPLQFALFPFTYVMRHDRLRRGKGNIPHRDDRDRCHVEGAVVGNARNQHSDGTEKLANIKGATFANPVNDATGQSGRNQRGADADEKQRIADAAGIPGESINGVEGPDGEDLV